MLGGYLQILQDHVYIHVVFDQTPGLVDLVAVGFVDLGGHVLDGRSNGVGVLFRIKYWDTAISKKSRDLSIWGQASSQNKARDFDRPSLLQQIRRHGH